MRLLFINQYYWPDVAATSQMMADLCEHLVRSGHEVDVLCSRGKYDDGSGTPARQVRHERHRGVHIHRVTATGFGKKNISGRVIDYLSFHLLIGLRILLIGWRYDAVVTLTTPPLIGLYVTPLRLMRLTRHVCWVMDLHPDCEFELGVFSRKNPPARLMDWLNGLHFRCADRCVVLGRRMGDRLLAKGVKEGTVQVIPVWGHEVEGKKEVDVGVSPMRTGLGLEGKFVVMYSGNAGLIHSFDEVCEAALRLRDEERFVFLFVGGGRRLEEVRAFAEKRQLKNLRFNGYLPRERLDESLMLGDVHLVTLRKGMSGVAAPSKLYGVMAAGRPVVYVGPGDSDTAEAIREADCGRVLGLGDVEGLIAVLRELAGDAGLCRRLGENGRRGYERRYRAGDCCERWRGVIEGLESGQR